MKKTFQFKVNALRTLTSPYKKNGDQKCETIYYLLVNMKDLPRDISLEVNPRVPKMNTNVAKRIVKAVLEPENDFYINNRGIVISAKSLEFDTNQSVVKIDVGDQDDESDRLTYGILDGGHTYTAIMNNIDKIPDEIEKYVRVEVITNVNNITRLSDARNTSVQVSDIALFNLEDCFGDIRSAVTGEKYENDIAYKDNENKRIHISEFLRLMYAFDILNYPNDEVAPIQSYSGKAQVFKRYKEAYNTDFYKSLTKQIPLLVRLYDTIECELVSKYCEYKKKNGIKHPKFGNVGGIEYVNKGSKTEFLRSETNYNVSSGYIYPIFGAFRALLRFDEEHGNVSWQFDPIEVWEKIGSSIVQNTFETKNNPQLAGKDKQLWLSNYRIVETQCLRMLLKDKENN